MKLKELDRHEIIEHKKRLEKHRKVIESDAKEMANRDNALRRILALMSQRKSFYMDTTMKEDC